MVIHNPTEKQLKKYRRYLSPGEKIVTVSGISSRFYYLLLPVFILFAFFIIGIPKLVHHMVDKRAKLYIFTNKRVLVKDGLFSIKLTSASYDQIAHLSVHEPFFKKLLFDTGSIVVTMTSGKSGSSDAITLKNIAAPMEIKNMLEALISHHHEELPEEIKRSFSSPHEDIPRIRI